MSSLWTEPPVPATAFEIKPTLIMSIWCTCYAVAIILFRCSGRWMRTERIWIEDVIILLSIVVIVARMVLATFVLRYGTNNVDEFSVYSDEDLRRRELGSQLVLVCRALYATSLWLIKLSVGIYILRLTDQFWAAKSLTSRTSGGRAIKTFLSRHLPRIFYTFLGVTYLGVLASEALECRPFIQYWQVVPTVEAACRVSPWHLFTMGFLNILTDLTLVFLPLPMIMAAKLSAKIKTETLLLMLFPLINIAFTCYRLTSITNAQGSQRYRTLLASIDILVSTSSANALVVISFLQDRGYKKMKYSYQEGDDGPIDQYGPRGVELDPIKKDGAFAALKAASAGRGVQNFSMPTIQQRPSWGSDEDLMRDDSDGGPTIHTTTNTDNEGRSSGDPKTDTAIKRLTSTDHLSPHQVAATKIVAGRRVEFADGDDGLTRAKPVRSRQPSPSGIVVETSWEVHISRT